MLIEFSFSIQFSEKLEIFIKTLPRIRLHGQTLLMSQLGKFSTFKILFSKTPHLESFQKLSFLNKTGVYGD